MSENNLTPLFEAYRGKKKSRSAPSAGDVIVAGGKLHLMADEAETKLIETGGIFQRAAMLVRPVRSAATTARGLIRQERSLVIVPVAPTYLGGRLTSLMGWLKWDARQCDWRNVDCPRAVAELLLERRGEWRFPVLTGVVEAPVFRANGTVLAEPGYDRATGLFFDNGPVAFDPVPEFPTLEDAKRAARTLTDLLTEFPWRSDDRGVGISATLSAILTPFTRHSLPAAPLFVVSAPRPRSGKSLLCEVVGMIATGRPAPVMTEMGQDEEAKKTIFAVLLAGDAMLVIDNVEGDLGGPSLCALLSQPTMTGRILGLSRTAEVSTSITVMANGNNIRLRGDVTARAVPIFLEPGTDRPEEVAHAVNLYEEIPKRRGELVAAALTILRGYHVAGRPDVGLKQWGGGNLAEWSSLVRSAVVWTGMPDPTAGRTLIEADDPVRVSLSALLEAWFGVFGSTPATVVEAIHAAESTNAFEARKAAALKAAIEDVAEEKGRVNRRRLGRFILRYVGRIEGGKRFVRADTHQNYVRWAVSEVLSSVSFSPTVSGEMS